MGMPFVFAAEHLLAAFSSGQIPPLPWTEIVADNVPFLGLLYVRVEAPKRMPFGGRLPPFLPYRTKAGSLVFPICAQCAETKNQRTCNHGSGKRSWTGAFTHSDISLALKLGYRVLEIFEVNIMGNFK